MKEALKFIFALSMLVIFANVAVAQCDYAEGDVSVKSEDGSFTVDPDFAQLYALTDGTSILQTSPTGEFTGVAPGQYNFWAINYGISINVGAWTTETDIADEIANGGCVDAVSWTAEVCSALLVGDGSGIFCSSASAAPVPLFGIITAQSGSYTEGDPGYVQGYVMTVAGDENIIELATDDGIFPTQPAGDYDVYAINYEIATLGIGFTNITALQAYAAGGCLDIQGPLTVSFEDCVGPYISDPCICQFEGPNVVGFAEGFEIGGAPGQVWTLIANDNGLNTPTSGMWTDLTFTTPVAIGTTVTIPGTGVGTFEFFHENGVGYNAIWWFDANGNGSVDELEFETVGLSNSCNGDIDCQGIPTASEWGLICLMLGLMSLVVIYVSKTAPQYIPEA